MYVLSSVVRSVCISVFHDLVSGADWHVCA